MSEYTPTIEEVRASYLSARTHNHPRNVGEVIAEFDRWHTAEIATAKAEAYREAQQIIAGDMTIAEQRGRRGADKVDAAYLIQEFDLEIQELQESDHE